MASTPSSSSQLTQIKTRLKTWERQFKAIEGRAPNKADIKANPEIAKMYSTYNSSRKGSKGSDDLPNSSSSHSNSYQRQILSTPKSKTRSESSKAGGRKPSQENHNSSPSKTYAHANSPSKLRKLVEEHSPRKIHYDRLRNSQGRPGTSTKNTPSHLRANPFDLDSGGGKGSPALFADLLLESKRDTPRTKARKFLVGEASPLKPRLHPPEPLYSASQGLSSGLSSFLKSQPIQPHEKPNLESGLDTLNDDEDDELLGPSPFKPTSHNVFQPLFDEPEVESDDHSLSPSKMIKSKWKINSATPFISQSQSHPSGSGSNNNQAPQCAQKDSGQTGKKKNISFGTKRKRLIMPGEEDLSFYEDLPDPETNDPSKNRSSLLNKKKRVERSNNKNQNKKTGDSTTKTTKAQLSIKKRETNSSKNEAMANESEEGSEESGEEKAILPNLPFGNPDQSAVYTELETFTFTTPDETTGADKGKKTSTASGAQSDGKDKGKAKAIDGAPDPKPIKLGTRKVLVRAYRPIEPSQMSQTIDSDYLGDDRLADAERSRKRTRSDRRQLLRERRRERKVRKILDGMTLMEKTLTNRATTPAVGGPVGPGAVSGKAKSAGGGRGKKKTAGPSRLEPARVAGKTEDQEEEDFRFELALDELEIDQQLEDEAVDLDDDWDDEPAGWKNELLDPGVDDDDDDIHSGLNQFVL
ncbi:uncharacterized protein PGTG_12968 [Puccinia graminis f. sp. tritici CRL 75-36-700-3]|uniref:DNA replication regulator SLD2 n=1 Tax=Puccinia graminis f. sp. tritici (strain CRL 75-36-700-3 / race SCCL) TaxID=418459 RepID=E3KQL1_PUCGT|nr:uncharacterized protein PGTG_12968 [Puccinia graminis f. sp. tritici CRL 75-36-700-3]EFP86586.2 hypothetical protein PGTG_12968 [Puccinia graminis f. sp. tritici CRL 75-36-700-3]